MLKVTAAFEKTLSCSRVCRIQFLQIHCAEIFKPVELMAKLSRFYPAICNGNTGNATSDCVSCPAMIVKIFEDLRYMLSSKFCSHHRDAPIAVKVK